MELGHAYRYNVKNKAAQPLSARVVAEMGKNVDGLDRKGD